MAWQPQRFRGAHDPQVTSAFDADPSQITEVKRPYVSSGAENHVERGLPEKGIHHTVLSSVGSGGDDGDSSCLGESVPVSNKSSSSFIHQGSGYGCDSGQPAQQTLLQETTDERRGPLSEQSI